MFNKLSSLWNRFFYYLTSPLFIAILFGSVIIYFMPNLFSKYEIELMSREKTDQNHHIYYHDFNNDGVVEKIDIVSPWNRQSGVIIYSQGRVLNQWNFNGEFLNTRGIFWDDINGDGTDEIFVFTLFKNKIILNAFNPLKNEFFIIDKVISKYYKYNNTIDCGISICGFFDTNRDDWKEFYFSITSGFSTSERKMCAIDIKQNGLFVSPRGCSNILYPFSCDIDGDGIREFLGNTQAIGNCDSSVALSDYFSWLIVLDNRMQFKFKPVKIGYYPSLLNVTYIKDSNKTKLIALNIYEGAQDHLCTLNIYNASGTRIKSLSFHYAEEWHNAYLCANELNGRKTFYIIKKNGIIEEWNKDLQLIDKRKSYALFNTHPYKLHFTGLGIDGKAFLLKDGTNLLFVQDGFKYPLRVNIEGNNSIERIQSLPSSAGLSEFYIVGNKYSYLYSYKENPFYNLKYLIFAAIYLSLFLLFILLQKVQKYREQQKYQTEKQISELQIKSITNQLDPHFTLNILNSIGALFQKQDRDKVDYIFGKFSKLLRETVINSDKIETTLENELEYIRNYLELQSFRFSYNFKYEINLNGFNAQNLKIPKTLVHTFVENAVKHGLRHLKKEGHLRIDVFEEKRKCIIKIDDNGVGREKAKALSEFSTGKGLKILNQILDLYQKLENVKITYFIKDKYDDMSNPAGTEVWITIPLNRDVFYESNKLHLN